MPWDFWMHSSFRYSKHLEHKVLTGVAPWRWKGIPGRRGEFSFTIVTSTWGALHEAQPLYHSIFFLLWKCSLKTVNSAPSSHNYLLLSSLFAHSFLPIRRGPDEPFYIVQAAGSPQFHSGGKKRVSSLVHCSSTSPWSHSWKRTELRVGTGRSFRESPNPTDPLNMNTRPMGWGSHFTGGVVRLGHPVPTLDLVVESRIHHHAGVGCATWKPK